MNDDQKFILEHKTKEAVEDDAAQMGLHMQDWAIIDMAAAQRQMRDTSLEDDDDAPEHDLGGDEGLIIRAVFTIGDLAFAPHVLDPERAAADALEAEMDASLDSNTIIDAMRDGGDLDQIDQALKDME